MCINDQQMHFNFTYVLLLQYLHQDVSASNAATFRVISLIQEYNFN